MTWWPVPRPVAWIAALYASGRNGKDMAALAEAMDEGAITDRAFPTRGLIRGEALARFVREKTGGKLIEQMVIPVGIRDLSHGAAILFRAIGHGGAGLKRCADHFSAGPNWHA